VKITVNKAMCDYLTVTTKSQPIADGWIVNLERSCIINEDRIKRYEGYRGTLDWVGVFLGKSVGRAKPHFIMQVSGAKADECLEWLCPLQVSGGEVKITRIDMQVTIDTPHDWSQVGYFRTCEAMGLKPEIKRSTDPKNKRGELITVYTGTRPSGRYNRVYEKVMDSGEKLLRFETEFSRGYAKAVTHGLLSGKVKKEEIIKGEIRRRKVGGLKVFDLWQTGIFSPKQGERVVYDRRGEWLISSILPVLAEYINRHDANPNVARLFLETIEGNLED